MSARADRGLPGPAVGAKLVVVQKLVAAVHLAVREARPRVGGGPPNVPSHPDATYKGGGWQGWGHWLGTGNIQRGTEQFLPFGEALVVARSARLASTFEWKVWCQSGARPANVPATPHKAYKNGGWQGWGHWLGTGNMVGGAKDCLPFADALAVARSLGLASRVGWKEWCKEGMRPPKVPADPSQVYKGGGWQGWGHWLGTGNAGNSAALFLPFEDALAATRSLGLANQKEWVAWCKEGMRPPHVPSNPQRTYKDGGWQGWVHWLGTGNALGSTEKNILPFDEALRVARSLRLVSEKEWKLWCWSGARPANVPANPDKAYAHDGWFGWAHWLCHANLDAATAPAPARPTSKRAAAGCSGTSGKNRGKRRRR